MGITQPGYKVGLDWHWFDAGYRIDIFLELGMVKFQYDWK